MWNLSLGLARLARCCSQPARRDVLPAVHGMADHATTRGRALARRSPERRGLQPHDRARVLVVPDGREPRRCAADSFGQVNGFANLYVNDASLIPDSPA